MLATTLEGSKMLDQSLARSGYDLFGVGDDFSAIYCVFQEYIGKAYMVDPGWILGKCASESRLG